MEKDLYIQIRNLAWNLLISAEISSLPIDIEKIAREFNLDNKIQSSQSLFENTLTVATDILNLYGLNIDSAAAEALAVRLIAPSGVIESCKIGSATELKDITGLPLKQAETRFRRLVELRRRGKFGTSHLERRVVKQFEFFCKQYNNQ